MPENVNKKFNKSLVKSNKVIESIQGPVLAQDWACQEKPCTELSKERKKLSSFSSPLCSANKLIGVLLWQVEG